MCEALVEQGVELVGDAGARQRWPGMGAATDDDFGREFLDLKMSVAVVPSLDAAIDHVNRFGTGHTEAIVTRDLDAARRFTDEVDAGTVVVNASTRFTDGERFGFGAEIGISTQKLHAPGPDGAARAHHLQVRRLGRRPGRRTRRRMATLMAERFESVDDVIDRLREADYLADAGIAGVVFLADRLEKPVLVEGPAGVGKTELAKAIAEVTGARLIRLQCYEGLDEAKALYEWNYKKQLLRIQVDREHETDWEDVESDIFSEPFLLTRPLLEAIRSDGAGRAAHRRGRPGRDRDRGAAARGAVRLPGVDPRARHHRRQRSARSCCSRRTTPVSCRRR